MGDGNAIILYRTGSGGETIVMKKVENGVVDSTEYDIFDETADSIPSFSLF